MTILEEIARKRQSRIDKEGFGLGVEVPAERNQPLTPFLGKNGLICEIKRRSPSKGIINADLDPVEQGSLYLESGAGNISVLTEEDYFGGSLKDLLALKSARPDASVLRKDFLLHLEDIELTYRAGADAYLLIAALLNDETLAKLFHRGTELGMTPLVEIHNEEELRRVEALKPPVVGINCRDLKTFQLDRLAPLGLAKKIGWDCKVIYESGIFSGREAQFVLDNGFSGILVGEGVVRQKGLAAELSQCFDKGADWHSPNSLWGWILEQKDPKKPLVKVCGITNREDAEKAKDAGADLLGFILAESPRKTNEEFIASLKDLDILKIGVVVLEEGREPSREIKDLLCQGHLDGLQFHGKESPQILEDFPGYKALRIKDVQDLDRVKDYGPQPVLLDAYRPGVCGGTGEQLTQEILEQTRAPLWLAGGLNPGNIREVLDQWNPHLVDLSSGLEAEPGKKDHAKIEAFFKEIEGYGRQ